ncbi:MAG TPA: hypothetical protein VLB07_10880, partial [Woeseiaceae bacterium]|nr:hypothetical protein [Woeseiaceae bacterium]
NVITISAVADRDMMPDPSFYCRCLEAAYQELKAATIERPVSHKAADQKPKRKPGARKGAKPKNNGSSALAETRQAS